MSQPKRYSIRGFSAAMVEEDNGVMVKWYDYAALQAENERLRKAGDAMADEFKFIGGGTVEGWHKAKGVQS